MLETNEEIRELIFLMHTKNELGNLRKKLRNQRNRLQNIKLAKELYNKKKTAKALITRLSNKNDKLHEAAEQFQKALISPWKSSSAIDDIVQKQGEVISKEHDNAVDDLTKADKQAEYYPLVPKHKKRSISDIRLDFLEIDAEYALVNLEIARFTKKNRTIMSKICRKFSLRMISDGTDNRYALLTDDKGNKINKKDMDRIALDWRIIKAFRLDEESETVA